MKISHPRYLNIGNPEVLDVNFPACLEKKSSSVHKDIDLDITKQSETVFHFPEVSEVQFYHWLATISMETANLVHFCFSGYSNS